MFIGHFGLAFAAKRAGPRTSLGTTFVAAQLADLLWPAFLLVGWEHVLIAPKGNPFLTLDFTDYPWSHSLLTELGLGLALGVVYFALTRYGRGALVVAALVPSHWLLDVIVHVPDLPLVPGSGARFGLGLWNSPAATIVVETILFAVGVLVYTRATTPRDRIGRYGLWSLVAFLIVLYVASTYGPPPATVKGLAFAALIGWPLTLWPWWVDRHRQSRQR
jgi:hypothetical protein